jgi:hypothetical protein
MLELAIRSLAVAVHATCNWPRDSRFSNQQRRGLARAFAFVT